MCGLAKLGYSLWYWSPGYRLAIVFSLEYWLTDMSRSTFAEICLTIHQKCNHTMCSQMKWSCLGDATVRNSTSHFVHLCNHHPKLELIYIKSLQYDIMLKWPCSQEERLIEIWQSKSDSIMWPRRAILIPRLTETATHSCRDQYGHRHYAKPTPRSCRSYRDCSRSQQWRPRTRFHPLPCENLLWNMKRYNKVKAGFDNRKPGGRPAAMDKDKLRSISGSWWRRHIAQMRRSAWTNCGNYRPGVQSGC